MKKLIGLLSIGFLTFMIACTQVCDTAKKAAPGLSVAAAQLVNCKRADLIEEDMKKAMVDVGVCKSNDPKLMQGAIADTVCPLAVPAAVSLFSNAVIPAKYECSPSQAPSVQSLSDALTLICKQLPL